MPQLEVVQVLIGHKGRVWGATWNPLNTAIATYVNNKFDFIVHIVTCFD